MNTDRTAQIAAATALITDDHIRGFIARVYGVSAEEHAGPDWRQDPARAAIIHDMTNPEREDRYEVRLVDATEEQAPQKAPRHPTWDDVFTRIIADFPNEDGYRFASIESELVATQVLPDGEEQGILERRHQYGDYLSGCPSIKVQIGRDVHYLTWAEAYNFGQALIRTANLAYYG